MKVKEVSVTASIAWSPAALGTPHLVCATAAQHADPASKNDAVQVYSLNLKEENLSMKLAGSVSTNTRFHDVVWGMGGSQVMGGAGVVACAGDNGGIYVYNGRKLMSGGSDPLLVSMEGKHAGPALTLDFNHHQPNLLVSGSRDCEVFIWDINDPQVPMSPGTKATLQADVTSVAWNRQVEHILASAYAGRCVVFDLRKSASIIQISEAVSRVKATTVCWHPNVATQLALASDDDTTPVCQIWDLRFASAPVRQCEGHQRGIQSIAWCEQDPEMLCTAAKDNRVFCWNPSTGELICEFPSYNQWSYEVIWSPRDPALVATASVDGTASVYSLMGGGYAPPKDIKFSAIADSFPGMEMPTEVPAAAQPQFIYPLRPPAFVAPRAGCSFGFGGRLLSWSSGSRCVEISQVVTEPQLVERSNELLAALHGADMQAYCHQKMEKLNDTDKEMWQFISASLLGEASRPKFLSLLGHPPPSSPQEEASLAAQMGALATADGSTGSLDPSEQFEMIASAQSGDKTPELVTTPSPPPSSSHPRVRVSAEGAGGAIRRAVVEGRLEAAVGLCIQETKWPLALILAQYAGQDLYHKTRDRVLLLAGDPDDVYGVVSAVVRGDLESVVMQAMLQDWKQVVVTVINHAPHKEQLCHLLQVLGSRLEGSDCLQAALVCYIIAGALDNFVSCWVKTKQGQGQLSTGHLQELVEMMLVVGPSGGGSSSACGAVSQYLSQYASLLATQGALATALHYLANSGAADTETELISLKERLSRALGYAAAPGGASSGTGRPSARGRNTSTTSNTSMQHQPAYRRTSNSSTVSTLQPAQFTPSVQARQAASFAAPPAPFAPPPAPPQGVAPPPYQPHQPTVFQPPMAAQPVAAPPIMGPPPSMGVPPMGPPPMSAPTFGQPPVSAPGMGQGLPTGVPCAPPAASVSAPGGLRRTGGQTRYLNCASPSGGGNGMFTAAPLAAPVAYQPHQPTTNPYSASILEPSSHRPPSAAPPPMAAYDPLQQQQQGGVAEQPHKPPAAFDRTVPSGWNDPPPVSASRRAKQQSAAAAAAAPSVEAVTAMVPTQQPMQPMPGNTGFQGFQGFQAAAPPPAFGAPPPAFAAPPPAFGAPPPVAPPAPPTPQPLPPEAQGVHTVLSGLYGKALQCAPNMMMRQTFEAVGPKLDTLYDRLRSGQVSSGTLQGLQSVCACIQAGDYHRALQVHAQTVAAGNFSEMSPFMPAIKKLLATCMQCQIYLN